MATLKSTLLLEAPEFVLRPYRFESEDKDWVLCELRVGAESEPICAGMLTIADLKGLIKGLREISNSFRSHFVLQAVEPFLWFECRRSGTAFEVVCRYTGTDPEKRLQTTVNEVDLRGFIEGLELDVYQLQPPASLP